MNEFLYSKQMSDGLDIDDSQTTLQRHLHALKRKYSDKWLHKGKWLTLEDAMEYSLLGEIFLPIENGQNIRTVRFLTDKLRLDYGITELEAFNIVRGYHIHEYVEKYNRIRHLL